MIIVKLLRVLYEIGIPIERIQTPPLSVSPEYRPDKNFQKKVLGGTLDSYAIDKLIEV